MYLGLIISKKLLTKAMRELDKLVLEDGSIKDRTTRGNKALWYHHTGLIETIVTLEMARKYGVKFQNLLNSGLKRLVRYSSVDLKTIGIWISVDMYLANRILEIISNYPMVMGFIFFHTDTQMQSLHRNLIEYSIS